MAVSSTGQAPSWAAAATKSTSLAPTLVGNAFESCNGFFNGSNNSAAVSAIESWATSASHSNNKTASVVGSSSSSKSWITSDDNSSNGGSSGSMQNGNASAAAAKQPRNDNGAGGGGGGNFDDGTAIWGSPSAKKSGVDWDSSGQPIMKASPLIHNNHDLVNQNLAENIFKEADNRSSHGLKQILSFNNSSNDDAEISQEQQKQQISTINNLKGMQSNQLVTNSSIDNGTGAWGSLSMMEKIPSPTNSIDKSRLDSDSSLLVNNTNSGWDDDQLLSSSRPTVPISQQNSLWDISSKKVAHAVQNNSSFYFNHNNTNNSFGDSITDQNSLTMLNNIGKSSTKNNNMIYANKNLATLADIGYKDIDIRAALINAGIFHQPLTQSTLQLLNELFHQDSLLREIQSQASQHLNKPGNGNSPTIAIINKIRQNMQTIVNQLITQHVMYTKQANPQNNKPFISGLNLGIQGSSSHGGNSSQILPGMSSSCDNSSTKIVPDSQTNATAKALDGFNSGLSGLSSLPKNSLSMNCASSTPSSLSNGSRMNCIVPTQVPSGSWVAAATKSPPSSNGNFEYGGNMGSWSSVKNQNTNKSNTKWDSNDTVRRNENGFDDGTAIWGNPSANKSGIDWAEANSAESGNVSRSTNSKDASTANFSTQNGTTSHGPSSWGQPFSASTKPLNSSAAGWNEESASATTNNRMASPTDPIWPSSDKSHIKNTDWPIGDTQKGLGSGCLDDSSLHSRKSLSKNSIQGTKQFQILTEMGFEEEEVETALRSRNMNLENAIEDLRNGTDCANNENGNDSIVSTKAPVLCNSYQSSSRIVSPSASPDKSASNQQLSNRPPFMSQNQSNFDTNGQVSNNTLGGQTSLRTSGMSSNVPSTAQLKHMVQQIQLAVQAGHLNAQILNQPLAPITLQLLYQLLQQIRALHQLQIHTNQQFGKTGSHPPASINVQITKTKQTILNLQNQIAAQQALFLKQNQQTQQPSQSSEVGNSSISIGFSNSLKDNGQPLVSVNDTFRATTITDAQAPPSNSLDSFGINGDLNQNDSWRSSRVPFSLGKSSINSDENMTSLMSGDLTGEFARAPGPSALASSKGDFSLARPSAWSSFGMDSELVWPNTSGISPSRTSQQPNVTFDLVPEFEPGKPWRGNMLMKNVENDPTITPGSLARSMTSQQQKDEADDSSNLFSCWPISSSSTKTSPTAAVTTSISPTNISEQFGGLSLQSNPWKYSSTSPPSVGGNQSATNVSNADNDVSGSCGDMITRQNNSSDVNASNIKRNSLSSITLSSSASNDSSLAKLVQGDSNRQQSAYSRVNLASPSINNIEQKRGIDPRLGKISGRPAPPPGLPSTIGSVFDRSNDLDNSSNNDNGSSVWASNASAINGWDSIVKHQLPGSQWLLLRNLNLQCDGSTIKSLCSQHLYGPMQLFHLYLNHGFALVRYSTREEAVKARSSLNNYIINGTTIIAHTPSDQEVQHYLQLGTSGQQNNW